MSWLRVYLAAWRRRWRLRWTAALLADAEHALLALERQLADGALSPAERDGLNRLLNIGDRVRAVLVRVERLVTGRPLPAVTGIVTFGHPRRAREARD